MTAAIAMNIPGARPVAGWWRDLASYAPRRLWFAHLVIHHIEALVECNAFSSRDTLAHALLTLLRQRASPVTLAEVAVWLALEPALVLRLVDHLELQGSVLRGPDGQTVLPAPRATEAPAPARLRQRRVFHFTDGSPGLFLPLAESACIALMPPAGWSFDLGTLEECLNRPGPWREDNHFPDDIACLLRTAQLAGESHPEAIAIDRAEQSLLVLLQTDTALLGFPVRPEGWEMHREPVLSLPPGADFTRSLLDPLPAEQWRQAWQGWGQQRSLPAGEVEACKLEPVDHRLLVRAPARLVERVRQGRGEVGRGESWLLAGSGRVRSAAQIELAT